MIHEIITRQPEQCTCIEHVRNEIDNIDRTIISLLANRFAYVKEVVKYKDGTPEGIVAEDRRRAVLECRRKWAEAKGLDGDVIEQIWDKLVQYFISEEMKIVK